MKKIISLKVMMIEYENLSKVNEPFKEQMKEAFSDVLKSGWFILGEKVAKFEKDFANYLKVDYCAGVASGLDALILAIKVLDLPKGSEIIVPSNTYIATILSIIQNGYKPVLVEPDLKTYNIDPSLIEDSITKNTKAIIVVHLYGKSCDIDPIMAICKKYNLFLIEDCAQAHGATYKRQEDWKLRRYGCFQFLPDQKLRLFR